MLDRYFTLEDPTRIEPTYREMSVTTLLESGLTLRGYIDRLDIAPTGEIRIVDYKTGAAPREEYEARALFQMKFYAVVLWRTRGTIPRVLQLIYLGNGEIMRYVPDEADLVATERKINALWQAIDRARLSGDWRPHQSRLCDWCSFQALCPVFGGTPPPLPEPEPKTEPEPKAEPEPVAASGALAGPCSPTSRPRGSRQHRGMAAPVSHAAEVCKDEILLDTAQAPGHGDVAALRLATEPVRVTRRRRCRQKRAPTGRPATRYGPHQGGHRRCCVNGRDKPSLDRCASRDSLRTRPRIGPRHGPPGRPAL